MSFLTKEVAGLLKPFTNKMLEIANSLREVVDSLKQMEADLSVLAEAQTKKDVRSEARRQFALDHPERTTNRPGMP
jgi:hypothetical protein